MRSLIFIAFFLAALAGCASNGLSSDGHGPLGPMGESVREASGFGIVIKKNVDTQTIDIRHGPMPEMNWAPMLMTFTAYEGVDLSSFKKGDKVDFVLSVDKENDYRLKYLKFR